MKILHVLAQLPKHTGSGIYFYNIINEFAKSGHEQRAAFALQDDFQLDILENHHHYYVKFKSEELPFPIVGMSDIMPYESTCYSDLDEGMIDRWSSAFKKKLVQARDTFAPDVVILHHLWMLTSLATEVFDSSFNIGICHNTDLRQAEKNPYLKSRYVTNIHSLDAILTLGEDQINTIVKLFGVKRKKITALGGGYDDHIFFPNEKKISGKEIQIAYVGKFDKSKGIYSLLNVYQNIACDSKYPTRLHIITSINDKIKKEIPEVKNRYGAIELHDKMDQNALGEFFRSMDIFVMPSFYEGLGLISIEALACGLWTVATDIDALIALLGNEINESAAIEYVKRPALYNTDRPVEEELPAYEAQLEEKIKIQIQRVMDNKTFPKAVLNKIKNNSWENISRQIEDIFSGRLE